MRIEPQHLWKRVRPHLAKFLVDFLIVFTVHSIFHFASASGNHRTAPPADGRRVDEVALKLLDHASVSEKHLLVVSDWAHDSSDAESYHDFLWGGEGFDAHSQSERASGGSQPVGVRHPAAPNGRRDWRA